MSNAFSSALHLALVIDCGNRRAERQDMQERKHTTTEGASMRRTMCGRRSVLLQRAVSMATLAAAGAAAPVWAQNVPGGEKLEEVVVIGFREALESAQAIKRDADTHVDSITATDIGAFPDKSVAEALQRMTGVAVTRFPAAGDTTPS